MHPRDNPVSAIAQVQASIAQKPFEPTICASPDPKCRGEWHSPSSSPYSPIFPIQTGLTHHQDLCILLQKLIFPHFA